MGLLPPALRGAGVCPFTRCGRDSVAPGYGCSARPNRMMASVSPRGAGAAVARLGRDRPHEGPADGARSARTVACATTVAVPLPRFHDTLTAPAWRGSSLEGCR